MTDRIVEIEIYEDSLIPGRNIIPIVPKGIEVEAEVMVLSQVIEICNENNLSNIYAFINVSGGQAHISCQSIEAVSDYGLKNNLTGDELLTTMYFYYVGNNGTVN